MSEDKSLENLPNSGLKIPESAEQIQQMRQSVVEMVAALQNGTAEEFAEKAEVMFGIFGIVAPKDKASNNAQWNQSRVSKVYDYYRYFKSSGIYHDMRLDLEFKGEKGNYGNIYIEGCTVAGKNAIHISPGACSVPRPVGVQPNPLPLSSRIPERNFYEVFERTIGSHPLTESLMKPYYTESMKAAKRQYFYIVDGQQVISEEKDPIKIV